MDQVSLTAATIIAASIVSASPALATNCQADLPMRSYGTSPAVEVSVNGRGKYLFLIDTGAQGKARADLSLVKELGLVSAGKQEIDDGTDRSIVVDKFVLDEIRVGGMAAQGVTATARDYNKTPHLPEIAGILGLGFFAECLLTLDYKARRVKVTAGALPPPNGRDVLAFRSDGGAYVPFSIGPVKSEAYLDTGSQLGLLLPVGLVKKLPLASYRRTVGKGKTVTNEFEISEVMLHDALTIGSYRVEKPTVNFADVFPDVVWGAAAMQELSLSVDQKNKRIRIRRVGGRQ